MSLMGKNYVTIPMSHSWERITSFALWVTHGIEVRAFSARKTLKCMHNMWPYIGKELRLLPQEDIPVNYKTIGYEFHLHYPLELPEGYLVIVHSCTALTRSDGKHYP